MTIYISAIELRTAVVEYLQNRGIQANVQDLVVSGSLKCTVEIRDAKCTGTSQQFLAE